MAIEINTKLSGRRRVDLACALIGDARLSGTRVSAVAAVPAASLAVARAAANERPLLAPVAEVAAVAGTTGYAVTADVAGAGHQLFGQQKTQLHTMWALRGLDPWSDPA